MITGWSTDPSGCHNVMRGRRCGLQIKDINLTPPSSPPPHPSASNDTWWLCNIQHQIQCSFCDIEQCYKIVFNQHYISLRLRQLYKFKSLIFFRIIFIFFRFFSTRAFPVMISGCCCLASPNILVRHRPANLHSLHHLCIQVTSILIVKEFSSV